MRSWFQRPTRQSASASSPPESISTTISSRKTFPCGIKLLHNAENSVVDIIFVHGLTGDREKTWTAKNAEASWPQTLLPSKIDNARVLTFGYDAYVTSLRGMVSNNRIGDHSKNLLAAVATYREDDNTNDRPIIFVCHSLGGLVCEDALIAAGERPERHLKTILESTRGIIFLGTPHHGSDFAKYAEMLAKSIGLLKQTNPQILAVLKSDSEVLARIQDSFHTMMRSRNQDGLTPIEITCFFEELPLPGIGVVVPYASATLPGHMPRSIRSNHKGLTKFDDGDDPGFTAVVGELRRWIKESSAPSNKQIQDAARQKKKELEWINAPHYNSVYLESLQMALPGTCQWLIQHELVARWMNPANTSSRFIWLYSSIAGVGKTVAAAKFVDHLRAAPDCVTAYFFCTHEFTANHGPDGIVRSWIHQLADTCGLHEVEKAHKIAAEKGSPIDLWAILRGMLTRCIVNYLVIDGLDEMEERRGKYNTGVRAAFLNRLWEMISTTPTRLLIISRYDLDIERAIQTNIGPATAVVQCEIDTQQTAVDLELVARHEVKARFTTSPPEVREEIVRALVTRADGMFVLLYALLEPISGGMSQDRILYSISEHLSRNFTTGSLDQAYKRQLHKILHSPQVVKDFCLSVLLWVQFSVRPLNLGEILYAVIFKSGSPSHDWQISNIHNHHDLDVQLLRHCGIFLRFRKEDTGFFQGTLHLTHYSVKEFLQSTPLLAGDVLPQWRHFQEVRFANAHLAKACLTYLMRPEFDKYPAKLVPGGLHGTFEYDVEFETRLLRKHLFYDYAAMFWGRHLDLSSLKAHVVTCLDASFTPLKDTNSETNTWKHFEEWRQLLDVMSSDDENSGRYFLSVDEELQKLCLSFLDVDGGACNYKVWLHYYFRLFSTTHGDEYLSKARTMLAGGRMSGPLIRAFGWVVWEHHLFATYGPNISKVRLQRRLMHALYIRSTALTALLVKNGAEMGYVWPSSQSTVEAHMAMNGPNSTGLFDYLLSVHFEASFAEREPTYPSHFQFNGTYFRAGGGGRFTPMRVWSFLFGNRLQHLAAHWSADEFHLDTIRIMHRYLVEINNRSLFFPSAMHGAIMYQQIETLKLLVNAGGDANASCWLRPMGTFVDDVSLVRDTLFEMFLELVPSGGPSHGRAFGGLLRLVEHQETYNQGEMLSELLSESALRNNSAGWISQEKLQIAARSGEIEEVRRLLDDGVNVNGRGRWYGTALYVACYFGMVDMVKVLFDMGADPNLAVHSLILRLEVEVDFLWAGLWRKSLSKEGVKNTPLQAASYCGHTKIVKMLLDRGADVNQNPAGAGTALYFAIRGVKNEYEKACYRFERRREGGHPYLHRWRIESEKDHKNTMDIVKQLLERGASVNVHGGRYWSPLQAACLIGKEDIVEILLEKGALVNAVGGEWGSALQAVVVAHPDPCAEAIKQGALIGDHALNKFSLYGGLRILTYVIAISWSCPLDSTILLDLASYQAPGKFNHAYRIVHRLLEQGADPTIVAGPWGNAIQAAAYSSSIEVLSILLDPQFTNLSEIQRAVNTNCGKAGSALNAAIVGCRFDKVFILERAGARLRWRSVLILRARKIWSGVRMRLVWVLILLWSLRLFIVFGGSVALATAVMFPPYYAWIQLDQKAEKWDLRFRAGWWIISSFVCGYVIRIRDKWMEDTIY